MAKDSETSLVVEPDSVLTFRGKIIGPEGDDQGVWRMSLLGSFKVQIMETLRLKSNGTHPVAFKVKTTAPKQYNIRPNNGVLQAGETKEIQGFLLCFASGFPYVIPQLT